MASDFRTVVISAVKEIFEPRFPDYGEIPGVHANALLLLRRRTSFSLSFYIMIAQRIDHDEFTVEAAWNTDDVYPRTVKPIRPIIDGVYQVELMRAPAGRLRVDRLWGMRRDHWWRVGEAPSLDQMLGQMENAAQQVEQGCKAGKTAEAFAARVANELAVGQPSREEIANALPLLMEDAADRTTKHLVPYFREVERLHGNLGS